MGTFDVTAYGAVGDGVTDDTAAIQAAVNAALAVSGKVNFPAPPGGFYAISQQILIPYTPSGPNGWAIIGETGAIKIQQNAPTNTPIFNLQAQSYGSGSTNWTIDGFAGQWANQQTWPANLSSAVILFDCAPGVYASGAFDYTIRNIANVNGCRCISMRQVHDLIPGYAGPFLGGTPSAPALNGSLAFWGAIYERISNYYSSTGALIWHDGGDGGQPNVLMSHLYINQAVQNEHALNLEGTGNVNIDNFEMNFTNGLFMLAENAPRINVRNCRLEGATLTDAPGVYNNNDGFALSNSHLTIDGFQMTNSTLNFQNPRNLISASYGSGVILGEVSFGYVTTTAGVYSLYTDSNGAYPPANGSAVLFKTASDFNGAPAGYFTGLNNNPNPQNFRLLASLPGLGASCAYSKTLPFYRNNLTATANVKNQSPSGIIAETVNETSWLFELVVHTDKPVTAGSLKVIVYKNNVAVDTFNVTLTSGQFGQAFAPGCNNSAVSNGQYLFQPGDQVSVGFISTGMTGPVNARANVVMANFGGAYDA